MSRKGREGFESFYGALYGARWPGLRDALLGRVKQVARPNGLARLNVDVDARVAGLERANFAGQTAYLLTDRFEVQAPNGLSDYYVMDPASIFPAMALGAKPGERIADFCAAPGGKSLIIAEQLFANPLVNDNMNMNMNMNVNVNVETFLVSNELSDSRRARLRAVIHDYLPPQVRERVKVTGHDATRWCLYEQDAYDRILLDAPCSGERHLLANAEEMAQWSPARSKNLAVRQYALLASALATVKPGGRIVYSTCSLSNLENDAVIARLMKKRAGEANVLRPNFEIGEATEHGWMILPDQTGYGPIYFAMLERVSN